MFRTSPLDSIFTGEFEPGDQFQTDEEIEGWLRGVVASDNHEVGTLSMLPEELGGVVDTSLKVYGTNNVRVAGKRDILWRSSSHLLYSSDASIIPFPVSAHMVRPAYPPVVSFAFHNMQLTVIYRICNRRKGQANTCMSLIFKDTNKNSGS